MCLPKTKQDPNNFFLREKTELVSGGWDRWRGREGTPSRLHAQLRLRSHRPEIMNLSQNRESHVQPKELRGPNKL